MKQGRETTQEERIVIVRDCLANGSNFGVAAIKYKASCCPRKSFTSFYCALNRERFSAEGRFLMLGSKKKFILKNMLQMSWMYRLYK